MQQHVPLSHLKGHASFHSAPNVPSCSSPPNFARYPHNAISSKPVPGGAVGPRKVAVVKGWFPLLNSLANSPSVLSRPSHSKSIPVTPVPAWAPGEAPGFGNENTGVTCRPLWHWALSITSNGSVDDNVPLSVMRYCPEPGRPHSRAYVRLSFPGAVVTVFR